MSGDWAGRAGTVEDVIRRRFVRRLAGVVPGTRIGRVRWPRPLLIRPWPWNYWWQAHLLDCLVDAHRRAPQPWRAVEIAALARTVRLRNLGSWTNDYYDDIAWFGLAVQRAGPGPPLRAVRARRDHHPAPRRMDTGRRRRHLVAPRGRLQERPRQRSGRDPGRPHRRPRLRHQDHRLDRGHPDRSADRAGPRRGPAQPRRDDPHRRSHDLHLLPGGVSGGVRGAGRARRPPAVGRTRRHRPARGHRHGRTGRGDPGLRRRRRRRAVQRDPGPLPRRHRSPAPRAHRARRPARPGQRRRGLAGPHIDLDHPTDGGPVFAPDWRRPARTPRPGVPEADLSVQLSAWMLLEAAARTANAVAPPPPTDPA